MAKRMTMLREVNKNELDAINYYKENKENLSMTKVASKFNIDRHNLSNLLKSDIVMVKDKYYLNNDSFKLVSDAVNFYSVNENMTFKEIQQKYGFKSDVFKKYCSMFDVEIHDNLIQYNRNIFDVIDTEEKAYWLGFILADGCVFKNELRIKLSNKDEKHLENFIEFIDGKNSVNLQYEIHKDTGNTLVKVVLCSKQLTESLSLYNIEPNKTQHEKPFKDLDDRFINHYIRGIIDGDGYISSNLADKQVVGLCGSENVLKFVRDTFVKKLSVTKSKIYYDESSHIYRIKWGKKEDFEKIVNYLYSNSNEKCRLERKYKSSINLLK